MSHGPEELAAGTPSKPSFSHTAEPPLRQRENGNQPGRTWVEVALLGGVARTLVYALPEPLAEEPLRGLRVRVPLGRSTALGVIWREVDASRLPAVEIRPVTRLVDLVCRLPESLLQLAEFAAAYYLAPLGSVLAALLPPGRTGPGDRRVSLGPLSVGREARTALEEAVRNLLIERSPLRLGELPLELPGVRTRDLQELLLAGWLRLEGPERPTSRFERAYEPIPMSAEERTLRLGRSRTGASLLGILEAAGRPLAVHELESEGASPALLRRLEKLGLLRSFDQPIRLDLTPHLLPTPGAPPLRLRQDQESALTALAEAIRSRVYSPFLLEGPTGSGKTEVFLRAAESCLETGRGVLLLVPEIALVPALAGAVRERFGDRAAILHSGMRESERASEWERIERGEARVAVGPRSALLAPLVPLGLVVVDEEQDGAYKQDQEPRLQARDLALVRARIEGATLVLVSATPSLEAVHLARTGKLSTLRLGQPAGGSRAMRVVDLRREYAGQMPGEVLLSRDLIAEVERVVRSGGQALLLRNRRGYAPILLCRACGEDFRCPACGLPQTVHRRPAALLCHWCGHRADLPDRCPTCASEALEAVGAGTERLEERLGGLFPGVSIGVLDRDHARGPGRVAAILERFRRQEIQILVGTQMLSKGHHFPEVALAAILDADGHWSQPDFRAAERAYNLFVQMAGRAGRGEREGLFLLQTFQPDHYVVRAVVEGDRAGFLERELRFRAVFGYPPFSRMVRIVSEDRRRDRAEERLGALAAELTREAESGAFRLQGPAPAPLERLRGKWRYQLLLRGSSGAQMRKALARALAVSGERGCVVDVDPQQFF